MDNSGQKSVSWWWLLIVIIVVISVVVFWPNNTSENGTTPNKSSEVMEENETSSIIDTGNIESTLPDVNEEMTEKLPIETTELLAVGRFTGSGHATRIFTNNTFIHTLSASIDDPEPGMFYEGWLVTKTTELKFFSTGKLLKQGDTYTLNYQINDDKTDFNEVVVTQETEANGLDGIPEEHVLEGTF